MYMTADGPHTRDRTMDHVAEMAQDAAFLVMLVSGIAIAVALVVIAFVV